MNCKTIRKEVGCISIKKKKSPVSHFGIIRWAQKSAGEPKRSEVALHVAKLACSCIVANVVLGILVLLSHTGFLLKTGVRDQASAIRWHPLKM